MDLKENNFEKEKSWDSDQIRSNHRTESRDTLESVWSMILNKGVKVIQLNRKDFLNQMVLE